MQTLHSTIDMQPLHTALTLNIDPYTTIDSQPLHR